MIVKKFSTEQQKLLRAVGTDPTVFSETKPFDLNECLVEYKPRIDMIKCGVLPIAKQYAALDKWFQDPLGQKGVLVINSYPTDVRAKRLAASLLYAATLAHRNVSANKRIKYDAPEWHRMYGGYADKFRDKKTRQPSMLVISNIVETSTNQKMEKLRDILDVYGSVPIVIATSTKIDPLTFMAERLYYPVKTGVYIGADKMSTRSLLDM